MTTVRSRLAHAWNAFTNDEEKRLAPPRRDRTPSVFGYGSSSGARPDRVRTHISNERSLITSIYTRLAIDVASVSIRHVRLDDEERYLGDIPSGLNRCLKLEANLDQDARDFRQEIAMTLFEEGAAALVPIDTTLDPEITGGYDIRTMRVGRIVQWYPRHVRVSIYNEAKGKRQEIVVSKRVAAIVYNPLYHIMNEPNSTLQRIIRKLNILDGVDEQIGSGKLDLIIQLPYTARSEQLQARAEKRRSEIEFQLKGSKYGIAYMDGSEKITQLNRSAENNLMADVQVLLKMLYGQLGLTEEVMNGTADEATMLNYNIRTTEPLVSAISGGMKRTFLTETARSQGQSVEFFRDPFKLVPISNIAEIADKFTRNEILTSNEVRQVIGFKPHKDPKADQLINSNINPNVSLAPAPPDLEALDEGGQDDDVIDVESWEEPDVDGMVNDMSSDFDTQVDKILGGG